MSEVLDIPSIDTIDAEICRRSLAEFVRQSWRILEPATPLTWNWHLDAMCEHIQYVLEDWKRSVAAGAAGEAYHQKIRDLLINVPPGSAKSRVLCVCAVAWMWIDCPSWQVICLTANPNALLRDALLTRLLIESDWYQRMFIPRVIEDGEEKPVWALSQDQNAKSNFRNTAGGSRIAISVGARITALRADALLVDDPHDAQEVTSDVMRQSVLEWWDNAASNRLNDPSRSVRIGIMQRLHESDWAGHVLASGTWEHLCIKMEFTPGRLKLRLVERSDGATVMVWVDEPTAIGWKDPRTDEGELMFPKRFSAEVLAGEKKKPGGFYSGQHQQDPQAAEGNRFKRKWFRYCRDGGSHWELLQPDGSVKRVLKTLCRLFATCDTALTATTRSDYTVIAVWAVTPEHELLLVWLRRERMEDPEIERAIRDVFIRRLAPYLCIERKQNGITLMQRLLREGLSIRGLEADLDKEARAATASVDMENGMIYFLVEADWLGEFERELLLFPAGTHDDQVDVLSYAAIEKSRDIQLTITNAPIRLLN